MQTSIQAMRPWFQPTKVHEQWPFWPTTIRTELGSHPHPKVPMKNLLLDDDFADSHSHIHPLGKKRHANFPGKNIYYSRISNAWYHWYHDLLDFGGQNTNRTILIHHSTTISRVWRNIWKVQLVNNCPFVAWKQIFETEKFPSKCQQFFLPDKKSIVPETHIFAPEDWWDWKTRSFLFWEGLYIFIGNA